MNFEQCTHWDARFLLMCDMIAAWSEDSSRKVGCVVIGPLNEIRSTGFNGLPRGVNSSFSERHDRALGEKYLWFEHAERNAIYNAASSGTVTSGCKMYVNSFPCADCARAIVQCGIVELNTFYFDSSDPVFGRHFTVSEQLLAEGGVKVRYFSRNDEAIVSLAKQFSTVRDPSSNLLR